MNIRFPLQLDSRIFPVIVGLILLSSILSTTSGFAQSSKSTETAPRITDPSISREDSPQPHESPVQTPTSGAESVESGPQGCLPGYHKDPIEPVCSRDPIQEPPTVAGTPRLPGETISRLPPLVTTPPDTTTQLCPNGSAPDANGNCDSKTTANNPPPLTTETCPNSSLAVNGMCITPTLLLLGVGVIGVVAAVVIIAKLRHRSHTILTPISDGNEIQHTAESVIEIKTEGGLE